VAERCVALEKDRDLIRDQAGLHWWPNPTNPDLITRRPYHISSRARRTGRRWCSRRSRPRRGR
jgi:hypothetical protein